MRLLGIWLGVASLPFLSGCGYIHFGRSPAAAEFGNNAGMLQAYSDLRTAGP
jgi:hypothetical protein